MDRLRKFRIKKWSDLSWTVGQREGVEVCRTESRGGRVNCLVWLGTQLYTTTGYTTLGQIKVTG